MEKKMCENGLFKRHQSGATLAKMSRIACRLAKFGVVSGGIKLLSARLASFKAWQFQTSQASQLQLQESARLTVFQGRRGVALFWLVSCQR